MQSSLGSGEVPCVACGRRVEGLGWTERCPQCQLARDTRARRLALRISIGTMAATAAYVLLVMRPADGTARTYGAIAVIASLLLVRRIVYIIAMEFLPE